jgi:pimeloyl-ACP methyl ester carboxylesterase
MDDHNIADAAILGHSMGGKTAMLFAQAHPSRVSAMIIVDMAARRYDVHHEGIFQALQSVHIADATDREPIRLELMAKLDDAEFVEFAMKGLVREKTGGFRWRPNLPVLHAALPTIGQSVDLSWNTIPTLVLYGGRSGYVTAADLEEFETVFVQLESHCIEGAGHWVHAEAPEEFFEVTFEFLATA